MGLLSFVVNLPAKLGRTTSAGSTSVTLASDDAAVTALTAIESTVATAANQATANTSLASIQTAVGHIPAPGAAATAASMPVTIATDDAKFGAGGTGITQPTGGSGLLGWLSGVYSAITGLLLVYTKNVQATGTLASLNDAVTLNTDSLGSVGVSLTGTNAGATVVFEGLIAGSTWDTIKAYPLIVGSAGVTSVTAAGDFEFNCAAFKQVRVRLSVAGSGSFSASLNGTAAAKHVGVKNGNASDLQVTDASGAPVPGRIALTVGAPAAAGRVFCAICTVAGNVNVTFADASSGTYPINVGLNVLPWQVTQVNSSGTTATATYENWK